MVLPAYREQEGGHGRQELRVNHGEDRGQVALPGPHKEQPVDRKAGGRPHHRAPRQGPLGPPALRLAHLQFPSPWVGRTVNP